jgi:hypothetical protein
VSFSFSNFTPKKKLSATEFELEKESETFVLFLCGLVEGICYRKRRAGNTKRDKERRKLRRRSESGSAETKEGTGEDVAN